MRVGIIARSDRTGLGNQTRNLVRLLNPDKVLLIDSTPFNHNEQHPDIYKDYNTTTIQGFISDLQAAEWIRDLDVVISCEIFYNMNFVDIANRHGVKTINQYNWEFADYLRLPTLTLPTKLISPSRWNIERAKNLWGDKVEYLPTPVFVDDFSKVREINLNRNGKKRFLHIMGRQAVNDRNGTLDLINALRHSREDFELVVKMQTGCQLKVDDSRVVVDTSSPNNEIELYEDFDAMILPRRYAGQCLPMTEALCSGLPVIMTDVSPNNTILPAYWLVNANQAGRFMTRTWIDLYTVNHAELAVRIDQFATKDLHGDKLKAYNIGYNEYSNEVLKKKWEQLLSEVNGKPKDSDASDFN